MKPLFTIKVCWHRWFQYMPTFMEHGVWSHHKCDKCGQTRHKYWTMLKGGWR